MAHHRRRTTLKGTYVVDEGTRILAGRYEVGELIGRGGMAEVHIGHDRRLGRTVAIKILRSDLARDPSFQNRFRREAQAAASLNHPAIVAVYDTGEDVVTEPTGLVAHVPFIVMEYVEGHTVRDILRDGAAVPIEEAVEITAGVLSALEYSHHAGIVHRDIKPANVMLTPTGAVKVMDFGIARAVADSAATMTQTQAVIGTAQYLSPEQARGEQVDTRSDLYSTGCLLFELLTGRPPFTGDSPVAVAYQHVRENPPAPSDIASDVPDTLDRITLKALAKERDDRYQTAGEFRADLEAVLRGGAVGAPPVGAFAVAGAAGALAAGEATQVMAPATAATQAFTPGSAAWGATGITTPGAGIPEDDERGRRWLVWLLVGIAVLAVGGLVWLLLSQRGPSGPTTAAVPNVVGKSEQDARDLLTTDKFTIGGTQQENSDSVPAGSATRTDPPADSQQPVGSSVVLYISKGPSNLKVPDVTGKTVADATTELKGAGFVVDPTQTSDDNPNFPQGQVTKTDPIAGQTVAAGSTVKLSVSSGNVVLGNLVGQKQADAVAALTALKLGNNVQTVPVTDPKQVGVVTAQDRPDKSILKQGTVVTITVGAAPTTATIPSGITGPTVTVDAAKTALANAGLTNVQVTTLDPKKNPSDQPAGTVISVSPPSGTNVAISQQITLTVSGGPGPSSTSTATSAP
ncbi:Stk1 family PASTA domain-containing Ser/Thr kinase [Cellulomonas sp. 73-145]|uniref:Stk1 family PASTA domain-containing Ser/Thr kinase n=1 Tax=Cellulomonas sp. 73-145 TaxID=1895739 RepID=UPI0026B70E5F